MTIDVDSVLRRQGTMASDRATFEGHWQEVTKRVIPRQDSWFGGKQSQGDKRTEALYDSTAVLALSRFAAAMESILTPRSEQWHQLIPESPLTESQAVKAWLEEISKLLFRVRYSPRSNFASQMHESYMGLGSIGTTCMFVDDDPGRGITYRSLHMGGVFLAENSKGRIDTVHREFQLTHRQAVQEFGIDNVPESVRRNVETKPDEKADYLHAVFPAVDRQYGRVDKKGMPWASAYIAKSERMVVSESGYWEFPYMIGRYVVAPGETYGRSPAMDALPDIKVVNEIEKTTLRIGQRAADPPYLAADDGILGAFQIRPGVVITGGLDSNGDPRLRTLDSGANFPLTEAMSERRRQAINDHFLVSLFQILAQDRTNMTATEVLQRAQEKGALLAPASGRQQSEFLGPMIEREIGILARAGVLPPPPPEWVEAQGEYRIEYTSVATRSQTAGRGVSVLRMLEGIAPFAQQKPDVLDRIDFDGAVQVLADSYGVPAEVMRDDKQVAAIRDARTQEAQSQNALQSAAVAGDAAQSLAKAAAMAGIPGGQLLGSM